MPNPRNPATSESLVVQATTPAAAEPDVTWGTGGIDDWGWTAVEKAADLAAPPAQESV